MLLEYTSHLSASTLKYQLIWRFRKIWTLLSSVRLVLLAAFSKLWAIATNKA